MENVSQEIPRLVFCQELDEKIDTTLMSVRKYMTGTSSYLAQLSLAQLSQKTGDRRKQLASKVLSEGILRMSNSKAHQLTYYISTHTDV